jgi:hypothetical protein
MGRDGELQAVTTAKFRKRIIKVKSLPCLLPVFTETLSFKIKNVTAIKLMFF